MPADPQLDRLREPSGTNSTFVVVAAVSLAVLELSRRLYDHAWSELVVES